MPKPLNPKSEIIYSDKFGLNYLSHIWKGPAKNYGDKLNVGGIELEIYEFNPFELSRIDPEKTRALFIATEYTEKGELRDSNKMLGRLGFLHRDSRYSPLKVGINTEHYEVILKSLKQGDFYNFDFIAQSVRAIRSIGELTNISDMNRNVGGITTINDIALLINTLRGESSKPTVTQELFTVNESQDRYIPEPVRNFPKNQR